MNINSLKQLIDGFKKEKSELGKIINPILEKYNLPQKEILEVCQIGKFVYKIDSDIRILEKPKPPKPDFIIEYESKQIGLEHTRIFTETTDNYNRVITLLDLAEKIYKTKFPDEKVHAIISIKNDKIDYKQTEKRQIATEIANFVYNYKYQLKVIIPSYISNIKTTIHSKISFSYKEKNWQGPYLTKDRLKIEIEKKEKNLKIYTDGKDSLSQYWLVLLIGSLSSASYQLNELENYETESLFDRVYLMTDFDAEIIRIK